MGHLLYERKCHMDYKDLKKLFCDHENGSPNTHLTGYITFSSFGPDNHKTYNWKSRTYVVSSDNKAFQPNMGGYSIFGSCLDGTDCYIRLEEYMAAERGGKNGWIVEECCITGYLLLGTCCSDEEKIAPELHYSIEAARERMLCQMAERGKLDLGQLSADYATGGCYAIAESYDANKKAAHLMDGYGTWEWEIKPAYIYSPLRIEFDCECR